MRDHLFKSGSAHPRYTYKGGRSLTSKGYVRRKAGKYRDQYEHRAVILELIETAVCLPPGFTKDGSLPPGMEIHHQDANKQNNCYCNLLIVQDVIHHAIERGKREYLAWYERRRLKQGLAPLKHLPGFMIERDKDVVPF